MQAPCVEALPDNAPANPGGGVQVAIFGAASGAGAALEAELRARGLAARRSDPREKAWGGARPDLAVVLWGQEVGSDLTGGQLTELLTRCGLERVSTIVWASPEPAALNAGPYVEWLSPRASVDEVVGKVSTLAHYAPMMRAMERELDYLKRLGAQMSSYFEEIDQEMRLAGRMQRDFLPRQLPQTPPYAIHALYRPASWVSGDMYDVFRIDEQTTGVFLADAMGHGVAAGLLTMFFRQALVPKVVSGEGYTVVPPREAVARLNESLVRQELPHSQFVSAVYTTLDTTTGVGRMARGGHPFVLRFAPDGAISELRAEGALLGLADAAEEFEQIEFTLMPGEKLFYYTDGLEDHIYVAGTQNSDEPEFTDTLKRWAALPAEQLISAIEDELNEGAGSLRPADDITVVVIERFADPA